MTALQPSQTSHGKEQAIAVACKRAKRGGTVQKKKIYVENTSMCDGVVQREEWCGKYCDRRKICSQSPVCTGCATKVSTCSSAPAACSALPKTIQKLYGGAIETFLYFPDIPYGRGILHSAWNSPLRLYALFLTQMRKKMTSLRCVSHQ